MSSFSKNNFQKKSRWTLIFRRGLIEYLCQAADILLLEEIYRISTNIEKDKKEYKEQSLSEKYSYKFAFMVIFLSLMTQIFVMYSSLVNSMYHRGDYEHKKLQVMKKKEKSAHILLHSFFFIVPMLYIYLMGFAKFLVEMLMALCCFSMEKIEQFEHKFN